MCGRWLGDHEFYPAPPSCRLVLFLTPVHPQDHRGLALKLQTEGARTTILNPGCLSAEPPLLATTLSSEDQDPARPRGTASRTGPLPVLLAARPPGPTAHAHAAGSQKVLVTGTEGGAGWTGAPPAASRVPPLHRVPLCAHSVLTLEAQPLAWSEPVRGQPPRQT